MGLLDFLFGRGKCPQCGTAGARKSQGQTRCPNPSCRYFDASLRQSADTPLEWRGDFSPASPFAIRYRNFRGEEKTFTAERLTLRRSRNHIVAQVAPTGTSISLFPGPHREPGGSRTGPAGRGGIQTQRALRSRAPGLGLPQEAQVQLSSLREDSREVSGLVAGPFARETARFAKLPSGARLFGCQQTSEIFCASFRKPNYTFILKAPSIPRRCAPLLRAMAFERPKRKSTDVTTTPISWAFSTPSNGSPRSCGSPPTTP